MEPRFRAVCLTEHLEDDRELFFGYPYPCIRHSKLDTFFLLTLFRLSLSDARGLIVAHCPSPTPFQHPRRYSHTALLGKLERVMNEILQDLFELLPISLQNR